MLSAFHSNRPLVLVFLPLLVACFALLNVYFPYHLPDHSHFGIWGSWDGQDSLISKILAPSIVFLNALLLNLGFNRNEFMERNNYLVSLLYVVFASYFHSFYFLDGFGLIQLLFVLILFQISKLNQNTDAKKQAFNMAFLTGLAGSIYPAFFIAFPFLFWILWVFRPFILREGLLMITGFFIPLLYARIYLSVYHINLSPEEYTSTSEEKLLVDVIVVAVVTFILILLGLKTLFKKINQGSIRLRKLYGILLMLGILVMGLTVIEYVFYNKIQVLMLAYVLLMFVLPFAFGDKSPRKAASFFFYIGFLFSIGKFFLAFLL